MFPARVCGFCGFAENSRQPFVFGGVAGFWRLRIFAESCGKITGPQLSAVIRSFPQAFRKLSGPWLWAFRSFRRIRKGWLSVQLKPPAAAISSD